MSVKLRCAVTGDLLLLSATAHELLGLLGKQADQPGILEPQDMPQAVAQLKALKMQSPASPDAPTSATDDEAASPPDDAPQEAISLYHRAVPLIQMIERAQAAGKPIVWGV
ncbi:MAG: DUF1840 domain-containing protein [Aquabacterium sp.]